MPGWRSQACDSRSRSRSQASARQLREAKRGGSAGGGPGSSACDLAGTTISSICPRSGGRTICVGASRGLAGKTGLGAVISRTDDSISLKAAVDVKLVSARAGCSKTSLWASSLADWGARIVSALAIKSSTSLCRQVCPQRCFDPGRSLLRVLHPLIRSSPPWS